MKTGSELQPQLATFLLAVISHRRWPAGTPRSFRDLAGCSVDQTRICG